MALERESAAGLSFPSMCRMQMSVVYLEMYTVVCLTIVQTVWTYKNISAWFVVSIYYSSNL